MQLPQLAEVEAAIARLAALLPVVESELVPIAEAAGRVLARPLVADRDSPPLDVSAMDGYALRLVDLQVNSTLPISETAMAGRALSQLAPASAIKIFTGAPVPTGADCVVRREDTTEQPQQVTIHTAASDLRQGQNIRRRGENIGLSQAVLAAGCSLGSAEMAAVASFGGAELAVRRRIRVAVLNTGDELLAPGSPVEPWQIRDSNGPTLEAWLRQLPWVELVAIRRVKDDFDMIRGAIAEQVVACEAVILTGGVSMGDTDHVPGAIAALGGQLAFHRLPIRPGKPVLGGCLDGTLLLGLPGNPVSVAVTSRVFGQPLLSRIAGLTRPSFRPWVAVTEPDTKQLSLVWYRLVECDADGVLRLTDSQGSGDVVSLARSVGFVTLPPNASGVGPWPLTVW